MARRTISQREAFRIRKRLEKLEAERDAQHRAYSSEWPSAIVVARITPNDVTMTAIVTARKLGHAVIAVPQGNGELAFFADRI